MNGLHYEPYGQHNSRVMDMKYTSDMPGTNAMINYSCATWSVSLHCGQRRLLSTRGGGAGRGRGGGRWAAGLQGGGRGDSWLAGGGSGFWSVVTDHLGETINYTPITERFLFLFRVIPDHNMHI